MKPYNLHLSKDKNIPQKSIVGAFKDPEKRIVCYIILDDIEIEKSNFRNMFVSKQQNDDKSTLRIVINEKSLLKMQSEKKHYLAFLYHELGHIVNNHFDKEPENMRSRRLAAIKAGSICAEEQEADAFAVQHLGKAAVLRALDIMYNERKEINEINDLGLKEIQLRKKILQKLQLS